jgi:glycosyltransferase involved in cell wall biosynthesis
MNGSGHSWICCQLGAREHYMVPAALKRRGVLGRVLTDFWITPDHPARLIAPRLRDRFRPDLDGDVTAFNGAAMLFEAQASASQSTWTRTMRRNEWFQSKAIEWVQRHLRPQSIVISYSYAGRRVFQLAKGRDCTTVLVQIDPGPAEEQIVAELHRVHPDIEPRWQPAPAAYWQQWREEIGHADHVVVHSEWSRAALAQAGVAQQKLTVIPLAYEPPIAARTFTREYPARFTADRPLRALFLGQVTLRKGVVPLLEAARALQGEPIEFILAGPNTLSPETRNAPGCIKWAGAVPRGQAHLAYRAADVFVFPTLSDGFGLTQLEAQAWRLPVIATMRCGEVVKSGINGVVLQEVSGREIAAVLRDLVAHPEKLAAMSASSGVDDRHRPDSFADALLRVPFQVPAHTV